MQRPISFTFIIIVTICSLMNIIALMPATEAYEILLQNGGGGESSTCCVWQEDYQHNFITFIPPGHDRDYYCYSCVTFDDLKYHGADLRNDILTYHTIDNTTTYWVDLGANNGEEYKDTRSDGYNKDACFALYGHWENPFIKELSLEDCKKIRGPQ